LQSGFSRAIFPLHVAIKRPTAKGDQAMTASHTATPGRVFDVLTDIEIVSDRPTANETESVVQFKGYRNARADAAFIVRACNSHHELLAALERYFSEMEIGDEGQRDMAGFEKQARAAIAKATA
jgi:hypothetical protein